MTTTSRVCRRCGQDTPYDQLVKNKHCRDGVDALCKLCSVTLAKQWHQNNPDQARKNKRLYKKRHPDRIKRQAHELYTKTKATKNQYRHQYYIKNREKELNAAKRYRESTKGRAVQKAAQSVRRGRKKGAEGSYTANDVAAQYKRQKGTCYWCGRRVGKTYHVDHVIPLAKGGSNGPDNIVIACPQCNQSKNDKLPHEWEGSGGKLL